MSGHLPPPVESPTEPPTVSPSTPASHVLALLAGVAAVVLWVLVAWRASSDVEDIDAEVFASAPQISQLVDQALLGLVPWAGAAMAASVAAVVLAVVSRR